MKKHDWIDAITLIITWLAPFIFIYFYLKTSGLLGE